jgi:hypothetical protein
MIKIKKGYIIGLIIGLLTVMIIEFNLNHQKYIDAFDKGYQKAHESELKTD